MNDVKSQGTSSEVSQKTSPNFKEAIYELLVSEEFRKSVMENSDTALIKYSELTTEEKNTLKTLVSEEHESLVKVGEKLERREDAGWMNMG